MRTYLYRNSIQFQNIFISKIIILKIINSALKYLGHVSEFTSFRSSSLRENHIWKPSLKKILILKNLNFVRLPVQLQFKTFCSVYQSNLSHLRIAFIIHKSFFHLHLPRNRLSTYQFSIKCRPMYQGESKFPTYTSYRSILATCCTSDANLFRIHFLSNSTSGSHINCHKPSTKSVKPKDSLFSITITWWPLKMPPINSYRQQES